MQYASSTVIIIYASGLTSFVKISADYGVQSVSYGLTGRIVNGTKAALRQFPHQVIFTCDFNLV